MGTNFNMLYAEGEEEESGNIRQHSYRTHTHGEFNFLNNAGYHQQRKNIRLCNQLRNWVTNTSIP